nr:hypothetical protein [Tanacetum cinerariifolium]
MYPRRITRGTIRISQSKVPSPGADETVFPTGDARYREAFPTVPSLDVRGIDQEEDLLVGETVKDSNKSDDKGSDSRDEMANVLGTLGATNILASGGLREQAERDSEIARIYPERELEMMIAELDRSNEIVAKYLSEYEQAEAGLSHDEKVDLIDELLMYQRNLLKSRSTKLSKTSPLQRLNKKFLHVNTEKQCCTTEVFDEKEKELWVELKRLYEPDSRDPLWALQRYMNDLLVWRLYDTCDVYHVSTRREHDIFMLVEKDYPLTKGLITLMLCRPMKKRRKSASELVDAMAKGGKLIREEFKKDDRRIVEKRKKSTISRLPLNVVEVVVEMVVMECHECDQESDWCQRNYDIQGRITLKRVGDEEVVVGKGVVVTSSSLEMLTNSCLRGIMVSLTFLEGLEEEALEEFMVELFEEDDKMSKKYGLFN